MHRKTFVFVILIALVALMVFLPTQEVLAASCLESAGKAVITTGLVFLGLTAIDCLLTGCTLSISGGTALLLAGAYGCVDALLWEKTTTPRPSRR